LASAPSPKKFLPSPTDKLVFNHPRVHETDFNHFCFFLILGLEWNDQYDIVSILSKSQIVPGKGYTGKEIADHLMQTLGKRPGKAIP
jgi:hypothetical protein